MTYQYYLMFKIACSVFRFLRNPNRQSNKMLYLLMKNSNRLYIKHLKIFDKLGNIDMGL